MYWHVTIAGEDRLTLFPSGPLRLLAVRALVRTSAGRALLFCVADDHVHSVVTGDRAVAGRYAQGLGVALGRIAAGRLDPARIREVHSRSHLLSLVPYVLDQSTHHKLTGVPHPAVWPGTCFPDLVGARSLGFSRGPLDEALPRLSPSELFRAVRLPMLTPVDDAALAKLGAADLAGAAAAVLALPSLEGRTPAVVAARRVVVALSSRLGLPPTRLAHHLNVSERTARRLDLEPADAALEHAIRMRIAVDLHVRTQAMMPSAVSGD